MVKLNSVPQFFHGGSQEEFQCQWQRAKCIATAMVMGAGAGSLISLCLSRQLGHINFF